MLFSPDQSGAQFMLASLTMAADDLAPRACPPDIPSQVRQKQLFALVPTIIIMVLSITTYGLRLFCRRKTGQKLMWDDYLMGIGLLISLEPSICEFLLVHNGLGHHLCNVSADQAKRFARISFALQRANQPALACIKTSIILFYMRIFNTRPFRTAAYCVLAYTIAWAISTWIVNLTVCAPVAYYYDRTIKGGHCRNQAISGSINGGLSLLGDVMVLALPVPVIWNLKINTRKKVGILGIFLLGVFVCVASIIRIVELTKFVVTDPTFTQVHASTWTTLEQGVAVISGNLPLLAPLFERYFRGRGSYGSGGGSGSGYGGYGGGGSKGAMKLGDSSRSGGVGGTHTGSSRTSKFHADRSMNTTTTVSAVRSKTHSDDPYQLSDEESQTRADSTHDIELDDRAILVKTQFTVTEEEGVRTAGGGVGGDVEGGMRKSGSWLRTS